MHRVYQFKMTHPNLVISMYVIMYNIFLNQEIVALKQKHRITNKFEAKREIAGQKPPT